ncbi:MAG: hypothetical protein LBU64_00780, partial [Planctomycetota bacterium]|nr:hypothetical protein [Planctomycetota bacterium]
MLLITGNGIIIYSPDDAQRGKAFQSLGFLPEDAAAAEAVLAGGDSLFREMHSPFFGERSLVHILKVTV